MLPDSHGRFGSYGGRYVPETLMPALLELEEEYAKAKKDRRFQIDLAYYLKQYVGTADESLSCRSADQKIGRRQDLSETGRPLPYRRAQDQQCDRPSPAGLAHEETANHCRNRSRSARCGDSNGGCHVRTCNARSTWARKICSGRR